MNGLRAGAANTSSRSAAARSMTLSPTRTPARGAAPPGANTPYGRLSRPNSGPCGIPTVLLGPTLLVEPPHYPTGAGECRAAPPAGRAGGGAVERAGRG